MPKIVVGVMGQGDDATQADMETAEILGELIAKEGWVLLTGGRDSGIMRSANRGAKRVSDSLTIGILPTTAARPSPHVDIAIKTDMHEARNNINVLSSDAVVACGRLGPGTASEVALALKARKTVILLNSPDTAYDFFKDLGVVVRATTAQEAITAVKARVGSG